MKKQKGFTLIELLVVIAIIGLLSALGFVSYSGVRAKARDAQRINDVKQLSTILETENTNSPTPIALTGCTGGLTADTAYALTTACTNPGDILTNFDDLEDPSTPLTACIGANGTDSTSTCGYSISQAAAGANTPTTADYQICFWLESGSGNLDSGLNRITNGGNFDSAGGCN